MDRIGPTSRSFASRGDQGETGRVHLVIVDLDGFTVRQETLPPGGMSTTDSDRPLCRAAHVRRAVSGWLHVELEGGEELDLRAGDLFAIPLRGDAWTVCHGPTAVVQERG